MASRKISRTSWVYWVTLAVICGQLALWISSAAQLIQTLRPLLAFVTPTELIEVTFEKMGALRFIHFYVFGLLNILIYSALALLLMLADHRAMTLFIVSVVVVVAQQVLGLILLFPDGSTRDWVTTIAGNMALALYVWLLFLAFEHLLYVLSSDTSAEAASP